MARTGLMRIGVRVMRSLPFSLKLALIGLLSAMPVLVVVWQFFISSGSRAAYETVLILCVLDCAILFYCLAALHQSITQDLRQLTHTTDQMVAGDLRQSMSPQSRDELGQLVVSIGQLGRTVSAMVANVRSNAAFVSHAGKSLAKGNQELSDRTEQQAANLEQTAASVEELSSTVHENANTAS